MKENATTDDEITNNIKQVRECLIELGVPNLPTVQDMKKPNPREIILFLVHLFLSLPYYLPKQTIEFECILDEVITKNITMHNPTNKPLTYFVKLEGIEDFSIDNDICVVGPKQIGSFPVKFHARISKPVYSRITFKSKKESAIMAAPLVFDLKSKIKGRVSMERIEMKNVKLYESSAMEIKVTNPYPQDVEFIIKLDNLQAMIDPGPKFKRGGKNEGKTVEDI